MKISSDLLEQLKAEHGPSYYLLDSDSFRKNFNSLISEFQKYYPNTKIAYSYKTNYVPRYCELVEKLGGYAEVVSGMEMMLALKLGVSADRIFFNGPYKEAIYVEKLLSAGGTVNIDSMEELLTIAAIADKHSGPPFKLGLRCNYDVNDGVISRFGFDIDSQAFAEAIAMIDAHAKLKITSLHCHFATRSLDCWERRTLGMLNVLDKYFSDRLDDLSYISLGGGIYGPMSDELKAQFPSEIPKFEDYARVAAKPFAEYFDKASPNWKPILIIEPGTALVADAMKYVCAIQSIKSIRGQTIISLTGSSHNINPNANRKNVLIEHFMGKRIFDPVDVKSAKLAGYTCIESDYLYHGFSGNVAVGDFFVFNEVGSYSVVMKPPFILPNAAIIEVSAHSPAIKIIKRQETFDDVFCTYSF